MQIWSQVDPKAEWGYSMSPYCAMANNPISYNDPDGDWIHIAVGAVIGAGINVATHWDDITRNGFSLGEFGKAALIGGGAGALTAATGGAAVGAGFAKGAAIGFGSGVIGDAVLQTGNAIGFGDQYNPTQTLVAGGLAGLGGGITGYATVAKGANPWTGKLPGTELGNTSSTLTSQAASGATDVMRVGGYSDGVKSITGNSVGAAALDDAVVISARRRVSSELVRKWYDQQVSILSETFFMTNKQGAMMAHAQRNALKAQARDMMADRTAANMLNKKYPLQSFDYYVNKYSSQGFTGKALWNRIIHGSGTPNAGVNARFGIN